MKHRVLGSALGLFLFSLGAHASPLLPASTPAAPAAPTAQAAPGQQASLQFFKDLAETRNFRLGSPVMARLTPDGSSVLFLRSGPRDPVLRLYQLEVKSGKVEELLTPEALLKGAEEKLSVEEKARRERMRMTLRGFTFFQLSKDGKYVLVSLSGRLYVVRRSDKQVTELPTGEEPWIDPRLSPDGKLLAAVRANELHVIELGNAKVEQVTRGATDTLTHGLAEFVAQEEMGRHAGYWWSPDSTLLAYQETDLSPVEQLYIADPMHPEVAPEPFRYPRAGKDNAKVKLGIVARTGGSTTWVEWDREKYPYMADVSWSEYGPLTVQVQTRRQQEQKLLLVDPLSGRTKELLTETDDAFLNLLQAPIWLEDASAFLWLTERKGHTQIELRGKDGALLKELTPPSLEVHGILDLDSKARSLVFVGSADPRESHIYRVSLKGENPVKLSGAPGKHWAQFARDHVTWIHSRQLLDGSQGDQVKGKDGKVLATLPSVAEQPPFLPKLELARVGKDRTFDAVVIRPRDFQPGKKYPVILDVYAGPGMKTVSATPRAYLMEQWTADQGYVVVSLDGRGTPGHGRDWERAIRGNLIDIPLEDQVAGLKALGEKFPELDLSRVGVTGWSFGGYFTAMAVMRRPDIFKCGVAGAPAVTWEDYDTYYTEKYLGLPAENPAGYKASSGLTYAASLERPLLLIHGLTDDNVYFVHTLKLADALMRAGKSFELLPLTGTHLITDPADKLALQTRIIRFFNQNLGVTEPTRP